MKEEQKHLPMYGVGPFYGIGIIGVTIVSIILSCLSILPVARIQTLTWCLRIVGGLLVVGGILLWCSAVFRAKIDDGILNNHLVVSGAYAWVRNPCYSAFFLVCTGAILLYANLWLIILPFVYWLYMTILMVCTEEKWLGELYGQEYRDYCKKVNRCIPWFPKGQ
ncbi:methyltransferase family protein [Anaerosporobacter faecicola]|uniref:methyltransferase family protein n=1 Tax=Anaerosporobacter faecicola TaxID=2718714 RepID=UPI00143BF61A|nr:isoprenylcysteine carboxylmethyltransferase family protein [Anaerosporobacter faecicola]